MSKDLPRNKYLVYNSSETRISEREMLEFIELRFYQLVLIVMIS